ncbi:phosphate ABC transporter membrane protein 1, PhoT family [Caminicella sporogenes DSM 14501]|uniref:Phosphate transport system permease protein n=1 Tax=Caminicella sporogenes DSM 14501 TaxID=1121266 RepID=A0A1M6QI76_9FIRM|nr:phosphate ABC transporter permease subunit PstC [Caminicella sporogenes]SHK19820.1 phosphate ABC transporter membrane protein 1, PhoT family [Caminicella sporogenes DSM 14501]
MKSAESINKTLIRKKEFIDLKENKKRKYFERIIETFFLICALAAIIAVFMISIFIFIKGGPAIFKIGIKDFLLGTKWKPMLDIYGILPMILASIYATFGAVILGVPVGLFTAIFLAEIAPEWIAKIVRPAVELLAGIPSVVYGFFGLIVIVPIIDKLFGGGGNSLLAVIFILTIMILPTIVSISETSIRAVPKEYKEGSLAMGASHIQTIFKVIIPAARSGILAAVVLGVGRAIGETMAVILVAGNTPLIPHSILDRVRTMTANIAIEMGYAFGLHQEALFATGVILFIFIMFFNIVLNIFTHKVGE